MRRVSIVACFFVLTVAHDVPAAMHISDISGREVVIRRGPALKRGRLAATNMRRPGTHADVTVFSGPDTDATNNDYRRIQNALNAAVDNDVITLSGTFDFTAPFAAAAWALGNDGSPASGDEFEVLVPAGLENVTLTATSLGSATIQGPGDLAVFDLEAFLFFDGFLSGPSTGWTISNLRILDFDLGIGMFANLAGDYNNTTISNNFIRLPEDLNGTVAPADALQNIAIHFSAGTNQSILNNTIHIAGNGVSDVASNSSNVGMQSGTTGGALYDGLLISGNTIHVLNAQSANPEVILGIWENGHAHTSGILVGNNSFVNDAGGNDPAVNVQRGFRVTSHSSPTTTVTYSNNSATGANIGFQWITGSNFAANQAVVLIGNIVTACNTGVLVQSDGVAHFEQNTITGSGSGGGIHVVTGTLTGSGVSTQSLFQNRVTNGTGDGVWIEATAGAVATMSQNDLGGNTGFGLLNQSAPAITAETNWWGNNLAASVAAEVSGNADFDPWLASGTDLTVGAGFQPFVFATTSGTLTTFIGSGIPDIAAVLAGDPVNMQLNGLSAFTALAQLLNFNIQMGGSDDLFTLGQTGIPTVYDAGTGNDTLIGTNVAQTWNITGAGSGNIPGATSSFANVELLRGGTAADSFIFGAAGSITGSLDGNLGADTLDNSAIPASTVTPTGPGTLDGFMGTATGVGTTFDNINGAVGLSADLVIVKTGPATATTGSQFTYTITVANSGPDAATNVVVTDNLPAGVTFVSATPSQGSCVGTTTITCTLGTINNSANATIALTVQVTATTGTIVNTATVTANESDPTPGNTSSTATVSVAAGEAIPTLSEWMLLALMAMLAVVAMKKM